MKILTVVAGMGIGGTERVALTLSRGAKSLGADVAVLAHSHLGPRQAAYREAGIAIFAPDGKESCSAIAAARDWRPDIVHIHRNGYADPAETAILKALRGSGARVVETNVFARVDRSEGGELIDAHCLLSHWCAFKWARWAGQLAARKRVHILPNPVDRRSIVRASDARREQIRRDLRIPQGRFLFGRIGQPHPPKWSPVILDVFREVLRRKHDAGLLLVGASPDVVDRMARLPEEVRARIVSLPVTASDRDVSDYLTAMDGFLHLSAIGESFGMVLCEAMQCGVPVVTLSTPLKDNSQLEVVGHRIGGLVALNLRAVPDAMVALIEDGDLRAHVRACGHVWVGERYDAEVVSRQAMAIYEALLSNASGPRAGRLAPDRTWVREMLSRGIGRAPGLLDRLKMEVVHTPFIYRSYLALARARA